MVDTAVAARVRHVNIQCRDPYELARFWAAILDADLHPDDRPGDPEALVTWSEQAPALLFVQAPTRAPALGRVHLDLQPTNGTRDAMVERALALGAQLRADERRADGTGWVVLSDPEGNPFCVEMSAEERRGRTAGGDHAGPAATGQAFRT